MEAVLERARQRGFAGVRLVQAGVPRRSLSLYTKLGFDVREPLAGDARAGAGRRGAGPRRAPGRASRRRACDRLCQRVHGHDRAGELRDAFAQGTATVVERDGRITGYATGVGFFGHAVGETTTT